MAAEVKLQPLLYIRDKIMFSLNCLYSNVRDFCLGGCEQKEKNYNFCDIKTPIMYWLSEMF